MEHFAWLPTHIMNRRGPDRAVKSNLIAVYFIEFNSIRATIVN